MVVDHRGREERYSADVVVVSCGAINSSALLLRSASSSTRTGSRTRRTSSGATTWRTSTPGVIAISQTPNTTKFQKTLGVNDYYWGADDSELPLGHIQMLAKSDRHILREGAPWFAPKLALDYLAKHAIDFWLTTEDLPHPTNRVTVDRSGQIHVNKQYYNLEPHKRLLGKLKGLLGRSAARRARSRAASCSTSASRWPAWRTRADRPLRRRPASSALDVNCKAHELDNLYVVDTSFFPVVERREPGAHRDGERAARGRPPAGAARRLGARPR